MNTADSLNKVVISANPTGSACETLNLRSGAGQMVLLVEDEATVRGASANF